MVTGSGEVDDAPTANVAPNVADAGGAGPNVTVCAALLTVNVRVTAPAAKYSAFPAWSAAIVHVPALTMCTVMPLTVQTGRVCDVNVTGRPLDALAESAKSASPYVRSGSAPKVMVCIVLIAMSWVTVTSAYVTVPAAVALIVQVPGAVAVTVYCTPL